MVFGILLFLAGFFVGCGGNTNNPSSGEIPVITSFSPAEVSIGQRNVEGRIFGSNFAGVLHVELGDGITLHSFDVASATEIRVSFSVDDTTGPGARTILVDAAAGFATVDALLNVLDNLAPIGRFTIDPPAGSPTTTFTVDASNSVDEDGRLVAYQWHWGDGSAGNGKKATHKYKALGRYHVILIVTDNEQATDRTVRDIEVRRNSPPVARFSVSPNAGNTLTTFRFDGSRSEDADGRIVDFRWDFGDGTRGKGEDVTHAYSRVGNFEVTLTVVDNKGDLGRVDRRLDVQNDDGGGGGGGGGGSGGNCTPRGGLGPAQTFTVVSADRAQRTLVARFNGNPGCSAFYRCGDVRKGGLSGWSPGKESWIGVMCEFTDLGNGTAIIKTVLGNYWPVPGDRLYTWPQLDCSTSVCR